MSMNAKPKLLFNANVSSQRIRRPRGSEAPMPRPLFPFLAMTRSRWSRMSDTLCCISLHWAHLELNERYPHEAGILSYMYSILSRSQFCLTLLNTVYRYGEAWTLAMNRTWEGPLRLTRFFVVYFIVDFCYRTTRPKFWYNVHKCPKLPNPSRYIGKEEAY